MPIAGSLTFHELAMIIAGGATIISIILSFYLAWRHALNYTKPREQRQYVHTSPRFARPALCAHCLASRERGASPGKHHC